jgi:hypothetical protein
MAFVLYKGVEWSWRGTITDDADGTRTNLTGLAVTLELRRRSTENPILTLSIGSGVTLLTQSGPTLGQCDFVIGAAQSVDFAARNHHIVVKVDGEIALAPLKLPVRDP